MKMKGDRIMKRVITKMNKIDWGYGGLRGLLTVISFVLMVCGASAMMVSVMLVGSIQDWMPLAMTINGFVLMVCIISFVVEVAVFSMCEKWDTNAP